ncbi:hypothetical protein H310_05608 [Aphanomyces invadans]|uniref:histone acetyltransferase n=1 Tax=Aphanomyces invadans TaxID=157072 RepID=A0A024UBC1_9STRA|nr:hypothetical protein H310_05608 [Aphanomyces invadans]ETW03202.1 hypothetical protein H310_05608 [Aphanomyces invadans]|eukprot:XP_008868586.1 hypothetical protein H310_05608 [Aphanomyces invadans]
MSSTERGEVEEHHATTKVNVETKEVKSITSAGERHVEDVDMQADNGADFDPGRADSETKVVVEHLDSTNVASVQPLDRDKEQNEFDSNPHDNDASSATYTSEQSDSKNSLTSSFPPSADADAPSAPVAADVLNAFMQSTAPSTNEALNDNAIPCTMKHIPAQSVDTATPVTANASQRDSTTTSSTVISSSPLKRKREDANGNDDVDPADASSDDLASAIMSRDEMAKKEEDTGLLEFCVIRNDGTPDRMVQLMTLKNIFSKQLPKMPKEYIVRLVFDRNHHSMVILKNKKTVVGGICYRPFVVNHFGEIAFCAITASEQVKGYGTRLMNHLKEYVKSQGLTHFLTYADNYAIGYFKKQGFSKVVSMPKPNWFGYIKDYDGGTLMECQIHHNINYLEITSMVHRQRSMILDEIKKRSKADIVYPGLTTFCDSRLVNIHAVPGVKEAGWSQTLIRSSRTSRDSSTLKQQLQSMWKSFSNHRSAWPFHEPVDVTVVTDYLDFVKHPIDLSTIQKKIDENLYATKAAFKDDLVLMCDNSMLYNAPDTNYYKAAKDLLEFVKKKIVIETQEGGGATTASASSSSKKNLVR